MCTSPKKIFYIGVMPNGKKRTCICKLGVNAVTYDDVTCTAERFRSVSDARSASIGTKANVYTDYDLVPCGNCIQCRLAQSAEYAHRGVLESDYHDTAYFITLTYNDANICDLANINGVINPVTDAPYYSLNKEHLQLFVKRMRERYNDKPLTVISSGEYGSRTLRPHYHLIVWDIEFNDLEPLHLLNSRARSSDYRYFTSSRLESTWGKGYVTIAPCNFATIAYVCRYNLKKTKNDMKWLYEETDVEKEFRQLPVRPGLGKRYFDDHWEEIYKNDEIIHSGLRPRNNTIKPPRYFDRLLEKTDVLCYNKVKERRRSNCDYSEFDNLDTGEIKQLLDMYKNIEYVDYERIAHLKNDEFA